jgi:hypothetical protein
MSGCASPRYRKQAGEKIEGKTNEPTHLAEESQDEVFGHQRFPSRGCQDEGVAGARLFCVGVELLGLAGRLGAGPSDDEDVLESVGIEGIPRQTNDALPLLA